MQEVRSKMQETRSKKQEVRHKKQDTRNKKQEARNKTPVRDKQMPKNKGKWHCRAGLGLNMKRSMGETVI